MSIRHLITLGFSCTGDVETPDAGVSVIVQSRPAAEQVTVPPLPTADVVDNDTLMAVRNRWAEDHEHLPALLDEAPKAGRLKSPQKTPYAAVECKVGKPAEHMTGGIRHDFRDVKITVYGTKEECRAAVDYVLRLFNTTTVLILPSGARFIRWWPKDNGTLEQDPATKDGKDVWKGVVSGEVWSVRRNGA